MILPLVKNVIKYPLQNIIVQPTNILPFIASNFIIGPHGITDLIYAIRKNKKTELFLTYGATIFMFDFLFIENRINIINTIFLFSSIVHFKHDFPFEDEMLQLLTSALFVFNLHKIGMLPFLIYMSFIHVPNHYLTLHTLLKKNKVFSLLSISLISFILCVTSINNPTLIYNSFYQNFIKSIIVSHIAYEEVFVKYEKKNIFKSIFKDDQTNMAIYI